MGFPAFKTCEFCLGGGKVLQRIRYDHKKCSEGCIHNETEVSDCFSCGGSGEVEYEEGF